MKAENNKIWAEGQFVEVPEVLYKAYWKGDRKSRYFEEDLKTERLKVNLETETVQCIPSREDSLERLMEENDRQFADESAHTEEEACSLLLRKALYDALSQLRKGEQELIHALFFERLTEEALGAKLGITQQAVSKRKLRILKKLQHLMKI